MMSTGGLLLILHIIPLIVVYSLMLLETGIACIQAYVFTILICIYLSDVIDLH